MQWIFRRSCRKDKQRARHAGPLRESCWGVGSSAEGVTGRGGARDPSLFGRAEEKDEDSRGGNRCEAEPDTSPQNATRVTNGKALFPVPNRGSRSVGVTAEAAAARQISSRNDLCDYGVSANRNCSTEGTPHLCGFFIPVDGKGRPRGLGRVETQRIPLEIWRNRWEGGGSEGEKGMGRCPGLLLVISITSASPICQRNGILRTLTSLPESRESGFYPHQGSPTSSRGSTERSGREQGRRWQENMKNRS